GGTAGLVTRDARAEESFGDIQDEHDKNAPTAKEIAPGVYEFSGRVEVRTLRDDFRLDIPEDDEYQTLAGYIMHSTGSIPTKGEKVEIDGLIFTILEASATRLDLIRVEDK
ncbi:MAG: hemolysin, partial [Duncaniella sp.]|nr:hemolysin [Duncaniella sp.]